MAVGGTDDSVIMYYIYQLRCFDGSLYTGIAADPKRRMEQHFSKDPKCARYTKSHPPRCLCSLWSCGDRASASRLEYGLKQLSKDKKERLAAGEGLDSFFDGDFVCLYQPIPFSEWESLGLLSYKSDENVLY